MIGGTILFWLDLAPINQPAGILIPAPPSSTECPPTHLATLGGREIVGIAKVRLRGRVLGAQRYHDHFSEIAPIDVVFGWGPMSDSSVLAPLKISLQERSFAIQGAAPGNAGNFAKVFHLLPADRETGTMLGQLKTGALVEVEGYQVEARSEKTTWRTLLAGNKTAPPDGEVLYIQRAEAITANGSPLTGAPHSPPLTPSVSKKNDAPLSPDDTFPAHPSAAPPLETATPPSPPPTSLPDPTPAAPISKTDLAHWYQKLEALRKALDTSNPTAVKAFNEEAARYMKAAHPSQNTQTRSKP